MRCSLSKEKSCMPRSTGSSVTLSGCFSNHSRAKQHLQHLFLNAKWLSSPRIIRGSFPPALCFCAHVPAMMLKTEEEKRVKRKGDGIALWGVPFLSEACPKTRALMQKNGGLSKSRFIIWESRQVLTTCFIFVPTTSELAARGLKKEHWMKEGRTGQEIKRMKGS